MAGKVWTNRGQVALGRGEGGKMAKKAVHLLISGKVQGVFYRATAAQLAQKLGLSGWVRNLPDGRVEAFVQGEEDGVEEFVRWCWKGPPAARVLDIQVAPMAVDPNLGGFEIRYD